jgi:hypothetical protein
MLLDVRPQLRGKALAPTTAASKALGVTGLMKAAFGLRVDFFFALLLALALVFTTAFFLGLAFALALAFVLVFLDLLFFAMRSPMKDA